MTVQDAIRAEALRQGVPTELAIAVARRESGFSQAARGAAGEVGVFQLMPGTASDLRVNPYNLSANIRGGVTYLAQQFRTFGNWNQALQAYNGGPGNVQRGTVSSAARNYARMIAPYAVVPSPRLPGFEPTIDGNGGDIFASLSFPSFGTSTPAQAPAGVPVELWIAAAVAVAIAL